MTSLNLPSFEIKIKEKNGKHYVFDRLRKQYVRFTPEELVRQHFTNYLIEYKKYPESLLANEVGILLGNVKKRCDTVVYDHQLNPLCIIEYKSPEISITQSTFDQIARYNISLQVPWLIVSNGSEHFCCRICYKTGKYIFEKDIPEYENLRFEIL